jgi:hypothetical protein
MALAILTMDGVIPTMDGATQVTDGETTQVGATLVTAGDIITDITTTIIAIILTTKAEEVLLTRIDPILTEITITPIDDTIRKEQITDAITQPKADGRLQTIALPEQALLLQIEENHKTTLLTDLGNTTLETIIITAPEIRIQTQQEHTLRILTTPETKITVPQDLTIRTLAVDLVAEDPQVATAEEPREEGVVDNPQNKSRIQISNKTSPKKR